MTAPLDPQPRIRFGKCVAHDDGVRTYFAFDQVTQSAVLAHLLDDDDAASRSRMSALLAQLAPTDAAVVLQTLDTERGWTIVTTMFETMVSFPDWLRQRLPTGAWPGARHPDSPLMRPTPETLIGIAAPAAPPVQPSAPAPPAPPAPAVSEPGEFTKMFMVGDLAAAAAASKAPVTAAPPPPPAPSAPTPVAPPPPDAMVTPAAPAGPGEFTQMFMVGELRAAAAASPAPAPPPIAAPMPAPVLPVAPAASGPTVPVPIAPPVPAMPMPAAAPPMMPPSLTPPPSPPVMAPAPGFGAQGLSALPPLPPVSPLMDAPTAGAPPLMTMASAPPPEPPRVAPVGAPPVLPPPMFDVPGAPLLPGTGAAAHAGANDYAKMIEAPLRTAGPAATSAPVPSAGITVKARLTFPVIVGINAVLLATIGLVVWAVLNRTPALPSAGRAAQADTVGADAAVDTVRTGARAARDASPAATENRALPSR